MEVSRKKWKIPLIAGIWVVLLAGAWFASPFLLRLAIQSKAYVTHIVTKSTLSDKERTISYTDFVTTLKRIREEKLNGHLDRVADLYRDEGSYLETLGHTAKAYSLYTRVLMRDPNNTDAQFHRATLYETLGMYSDALDAWRTAIERDPGRSASYEHLARITETIFSDPEKANGIYVEGLVRGGNAIALMRSYAVFLERQGQQSTALLYWKAVVQKDPSDEQAQVHVRALEPK